MSTVLHRVIKHSSTIVCAVAVFIAACGADVASPDDGGPNASRSSEEASGTGMMRPGQIVIEMDAGTSGATGDGPRAMDVMAAAPDSRPIDLAPDSRPTDLAPGAPPPRVPDGGTCVEGEMCSAKNASGLFVSGYCRGGSCCNTGCWDGKVCHQDQSPDHCGPKGSICKTCGWVSQQAAGFCLVGEFTQFRAACTGDGACSGTATTGPARCCSNGTCRTP